MKNISKINATPQVTCACWGIHWCVHAELCMYFGYAFLNVCKLVCM